MSEDWQPEQYKDTFQEQIMALVEQKAKEGKVEAVSEPDDDGGERRSADVIDLTELLKRSLGAKPAASKQAAKAAPKKTEKTEKAEKPARKPAAKTATKPAASRTTKKKAS